MAMLGPSSTIRGFAAGREGAEEGEGRARWAEGGRLGTERAAGTEAAEEETTGGTEGHRLDHLGNGDEKEGVESHLFCHKGDPPDPHDRDERAVSVSFVETAVVAFHRSATCGCKTGGQERATRHDEQQEQEKLKE